MRQHFRDRIYFKFLLGVSNYHDGHHIKWPPRYSNGKTTRVIPEWERLLQVAGDNAHESSYKLIAPSEYQNEADRIFATLKIGQCRKLLAIGPGSKMPAKRWPKESYSKLGSLILERYHDVSLAVFGGQEDADIGNELCNVWGERAFNLAGKLSIYGSAAALERCALYVGNDTGTMHLAAMIGKPCVAIFSSRDYSGKWEPYGDKHVMLRTDPECAGCMLEVCTKNTKCLTAIGPDDVMKEIDLMMRMKID